MNYIRKLFPPSLKFVFLPGLILTLAVILALFAFEAYVLILNHFAGDLLLPSNFGNHPQVIKMLTDQEKKDTFRFVIVGDTKSDGTFKRIAEQLRRETLDFAVLLGDVSFKGNESYHRYLRAEMDETDLEVPTFYVVGNHDVDPDTFPIRRFEEIYGPSIFSFEYQDCLFIVLRVLDKPYSNRESIDFLTNLLSEQMGKYRNRFVFLHNPPSISPDFSVRSINSGPELVALFNRLHVDYVFGGDFHGYARTRFGYPNYLITGGGGANLKGDNQFHHAVVVTVGKNLISERILKVDKSINLEDALGRRAIGDVYPWLLENRAGVLGANAGLLAILLGTICALRKHLKAARLLRAGPARHPT